VNITPIKLEKSTNRLKMPVYKGDKLEPVQVIDVACIVCVIGRVHNKVFWTVIDRGEMGQLLESYRDPPANAND
jgi:hypothetical protein